MTSTSPLGDRAPVSRIQRFLPFLSYSFMALGGAGAGFYAIKVVNAFADMENSGIGEISRSLASGISAVTVGLLLAIAVGFVAVIVHGAMLFAQKQTTSPSLLPVFFMALLGMAAPVLAWPVIMDLITAPLDPKLDVAQLQSSTMTYGVAAIILGLLTPLVGLALTLMPMRAAPGKKFGSFVVVLIAEALMIGALIYLTMQARAITKMAMGI
jgi:hypothetical protein